MESTVENVLVTPEMAEEILGQSNQEYQRPIRKQQVDFLAAEMKAGRFTTNTIVFCQNGSDKRDLVNGRHTLNAIIAAETPLTLPIEVVHVDNQKDAAMVYATLDKQMKRTVADTFRAYGLEQEFEMSYSDVSRYGACARYMLNNFRASSGSKSIIPDVEIVNFMREWLSYAKTYFGYIGDTGLFRLVFLRREVFAVGLMTCRHSSKAGDFWKYVATDNGLFLDDPRKTLYQYLKDTGMAGGNAGAMRKKKLVSTAESIRCVVLAWNAYIDERPLKILRITNPTLPFSIKDTPYKNII